MSHDTLIHRLVRPGVRWVAPSGVTPNQITTLRLATALGAATALAMGRPLWTAVGGGVFLASLLLDRIDGELARQTGLSSPAGHRYDLVSDCTANAVALVGLGVGRIGVLGWPAVALGLLAGGGVGALFWLLNVAREGPVNGLRLARGRIVIDPDDAMALLPVLLWLGAATPVLAAAAMITPAAALWLGGWAWRDARRARTAPAPAPAPAPASQAEAATSPAPPSPSPRRRSSRRQR